MSGRNHDLDSKHALSEPSEKGLARESEPHMGSGIAAEGSVTIKNDFFHALDLRRFRISAIGGRTPRVM